MTDETEVKPAPAPVMRSGDRETVEIVEDVEIVAAAEEARESDESENPRGDIYKRHSEKRNEEIASQDPNYEPAVVESYDKSLENAGESHILRSDGDRTSTPPDEDPLVEVVVFEAVRMVPKSKVDKAGGLQMYQMREAAQEQMRRNASTAKSLAEREKALDARERQTAKPPAVPATDQRTRQTPADLPSDDQTLETMARQYQEAVYDGEDNAPLILTQMVKAAAKSGEPFDRDGFRQQVTKDVLGSQRKTKVVKARNALFEANPQLDKNSPKFDHRLFQAVDDETDVVERQHPEWEPDEVMGQAWKNVNKWKGSPLTDTMADKLTDKQNLNRPIGGTGRFKPPAPAPRQTNSDYVSKQRIARGLEA